MRQVNTRFFLILLAGAVCAGAALFGAHRLQAGNIAAALLWQADQAAKSGKAGVAARYLGRYLEFVPDDTEQRARLAAVLADEKVAVTPAARKRAEFVINQVLAWDPQRHELRQALCRIAMDSQKLDLAREHLDILQSKLPASGEVACLLGNWQELQLIARAGTFKKGEHEALLDAARQAYEKAVAAAPRKAEAYVRLVAVLRQIDFGKEPRHAPRIAAIVAAALENAPDDGAVLSLAAQHAQEKGDTAAALKYLEAGLAKDPSEPRLYQALARLHARQGRRTEAIAQLRAGLKATGKAHQFELGWTLANLLLDDAQMEAARPIIGRIREVNPTSADYLDARCLMQKGLWHEAAAKLERLRPSFKAVAELALQADLFLGLCYEKIAEPWQQLASFQRAVKADPTSPLARHGEATAHWALGQPQAALAKLHALIAANARHPDLARWRIEYARMILQGMAPSPERSRMVRHELDEAEKDRAWAVDCALLRTELYLAEEKADQAETELRRARTVDPQRFEPWVALAVLAMEAKQPHKAETLLADAAARVKDSPEFRLACIPFWARYAKEQVERLDAIAKGLEKFPAGDQARVLEALAEAHLRAGRPALAAKALRQLAAMPQHAEDVRVRMQLLGLALAQDDEAGAERVLAQVKTIEGESATEWSYGEALRLIHHARRGDKQGLVKARTLLNAAAARRPDWPAVYLARGEVDELDRRSDLAIVSYRTALDKGSRDPHGLYQLLKLLSDAQRFDEAEQLIRKMDQVGLGTGVGRKLVMDILLKDQGSAGAVRLSKNLTRLDNTSYRDQLLQGQMLAAGGRSSPEAEAAYRRAAALGAAQPEVWVALVRYLGVTGQFDKAVAAINEAAKKLSAEAKPLALAQCYDVLGAADRAEEAYAAVVAAQPTSVLAHRAAADFLLRAGKPRAAEPLLRAVLDPKFGASADEVASTRRSLALALARGGDARRLSEALELAGLALDDTGRVDPKSIATAPEGRLLQAGVLGAAASHALRAQAKDLLEELNQREPLSPEDQLQLARLLHLHGPDPASWAKAKGILEAIVTAQPNNPRFLAFDADLLFAHKEVEAADKVIARLETLEKDRKLPAGFLDTVELRARALEMAGKTTEALALLKGFAATKDAPPSRLLLLAGLHGRLGRFGEAIDLCYQVKEAGYREEAYGAANGILRAGKLAADKVAADKAAAAVWDAQVARHEAGLRASIKIDADNRTLHLQLADLLELAGRAGQAEPIWRAVLEQDADNLVALNNLAWHLAGQADKGQEALGLIQRAIQKHGARPELLDTRAVVYLNLGQAKEAVRDLESAVRDAPTPTRYFHLTRAHHLAKDIPQAVAALQRASALGLDVQQLQPADQAAYRSVVPELQKQ